MAPWLGSEMAFRSDPIAPFVLMVPFTYDNSSLFRTECAALSEKGSDILGFVLGHANSVLTVNRRSMLGCPVRVKVMREQPMKMPTFN